MAALDAEGLEYFEKLKDNNLTIIMNKAYNKNKSNTQSGYQSETEEQRSTNARNAKTSSSIQEKPAEESEEEDASKKTAVKTRATNKSKK